MPKKKFLVLYFSIGAIACTPLLAQNLNLKVNGEYPFENKVIDSIGYKNSFTNYKSLYDQINTLHLKLQKVGYIESKLTSTTKNNDSTYTVLFHLKKKYHTIYIYYNKNTISKSFLESISDHVTSNYFVTTIQKSEAILNQINLTLSANGQPFISHKLENIAKKDNHALKANLSISNATIRTIDNIVLKGYEKFPKTFLKYFLNLNQGGLFDLNSIKKKVQDLSALKFTSQTKTPEVLFTNDSTTLYLYLKKTKSNSFDGFLGFGTNEASNKIEFNGYLNLNLTNNLNYGETFKLIYKSDATEQKTFQSNINIPYLFGSAIGTELSLNIFKKDSTFTTTNQSVNLFYQINRNQILFTGIKTIQSNSLLNTNQPTLIQDYEAIFYSLKYEFIKHQYNNKLFPINFILDLKVGIGTRTSSSIKQEQSVFSLNSHKIFNLNTKNSFYIKLNTEGIHSDNYLNNELFRFGGINSIRGFEEQSLIASFYNVLNTEYRYLLNPNIYVHSIIDAAYFENELTNTKEKLYGFGLGLGLLTKAGVLRLNYASGKSENQKFKLSNSKFHISLNANF